MRLEKECVTAPPKEPLLHPNLAELYRKKVSDLQSVLTGDEADPEAANLVRSLVDKIVLTPSDGKLQVDLAGDLAAILAMATNKKPAGNEPDGMVQVKMVAGARNPRGLTRPFVVV